MAFNLPRLPAGGLTGATPDQQQIWWQQVVEAIEGQEGGQDAIIADIQTLQTQMAATIAGLSAAVADIQAVLRNDSISSSWTSPGAILSASDAGTNATITIAAHTRKYGDATSKAVNGGSVIGLSYSTLYYVYYDDAARAGGAVTYQATTNANTSAPNAAIGRHFCGSITTPASGGGATSGGPTPPGGDYGGPGAIP